MQQQPLQLAIFTQQLERAAVVEQLTAEKGWELSIITDETNAAYLSQSRSIALILIDLDWPDAIALFHRLAQEEPQVPRLALAPPNHLVALQEVHQAGAGGYVAYPINHQHFFAAVEQALNNATTRTAHDRGGRVTALVSLKGGIGRSTLAVNLAIALQQSGAKNLILAEVHHGLGQLPLMLNVQPRHTIANLAGEATIDPELLQGYLQPHQSGIRLLAAPSEPAQVNELSAETWQQTISMLTTLAPHVVIDTAAAADVALAQVLTHATDLLVITDPTVASLCNARGLLETVQGGATAAPPIHIVLNRAEVSGGLSPAMVEEYLGEPIASTVPFEPALATFAGNRGIPLVLSHPRTRFSRSIHQLAAQLQRGMAAPAPSAQRSSLFAWFVRRRPDATPQQTPQRTHAVLEQLS